MTPENLRFHAAGHLAAAHALASAANVKGAKQVLSIVRDFVDSDLVNAPPQVKRLVYDAVESPRAALGEIALLESWFCDPFNAVIEKSGSKF